VRIQRETIDSTCAFCQGILIFLKKNYLGVAEFKKVLEEKGGFISAHWDGTAETEEKIKEITKATIRCMPLEGKIEKGICVLTGRESARRVLFAKAY